MKLSEVRAHLTESRARLLEVMASGLPQETYWKSVGAVETIDQVLDFMAPTPQESLLEEEFD